ncbi:MAG TPA: hypothetical protein VME17_08130 [Bryobacteraceae bacterium]|nr:hypothetical protein [Bryobacteraceae bacterium]
MSARKILRIALILIVLYLLWTRAAYLSHGVLIACIAVSVILVAALVFQVITSLRKPRKLRDDVPKHPLGLDS